MNRHEWLAARRQGVSASDVAGILGLSQYDTPTSIYFDKVGLTAEKEISDEMEFGTEIEQIVANKWARRTRKAMLWLNQELFSHAEEPWMLATPDAVLVGPGHEQEQGLEIKTRGWLKDGDGWGEEGTDEIPDSYLTQVQWQAAVMGWRGVHVALFLTGARKLRSYYVYADKELQSSMIERCREFWTQHVLKQVAPPIDWTDASDAYLKARFPHALEAPRDATDEEAMLAVQYARVRKAFKDADKAKHELSNRLKELIGDSKGIVGDGFKLSWYETAASTYTVTRKAGRTLKPSGRIFKAGEEEE